MTYAPSSQGFSLFPAVSSAPHAFTICSRSHSPRETHAMFEDLVSVFRMNGANENRRIPKPAKDHGKGLKKSKSTPSLRKTWRMLLGLDVSEPQFEFVDPESKLSTPPSEADTEFTMESLVDEEFGVFGKHLSKPADALTGDDSDGA